MSGSVSTDLPAVAVTDLVDAAVTKLVKPGSRTTEFLGLVITFAGALATLCGAFNTSSAQANGIIKAVGLIAAAVASIGYSLSRGKTKDALATLASTVVAARRVPTPFVPAISRPPQGNVGLPSVAVDAPSAVPPVDPPVDPPIVEGG